MKYHGWDSCREYSELWLSIIKVTDVSLSIGRKKPSWILYWFHINLFNSPISLRFNADTFFFVLIYFLTFSPFTFFFKIYQQSFKFHYIMHLRSLYYFKKLRSLEREMRYWEIYQKILFWLQFIFKNMVYSFQRQ